MVGVVSMNFHKKTCQNTLNLAKIGGVRLLPPPPPLRAPVHRVTQTYDFLSTLESHGTYMDSCFIIVNHLLTWQQASDRCQSLGGQLADVSSEEENDIIYQLTDSSK